MVDFLAKTPSSSNNNNNNNKNNNNNNKEIASFLNNHIELEVLIIQ